MPPKRSGAKRTRRRRRRYTMLHCTLNTNYAPKTAEAEQRLSNQLESFVRTKLSQISVWRRANLIRIEPSFDVIEQIRVEGVGIERGPKQHRMHMHFVVIVQHRGTVFWNHGQRQWQELLKEHIPYLKGPNAKTSLMNTRALNYISKESAVDTGGKVRQLGIQAPVRF